ncbi:MAG: acyl-ACP--UDP-N-acetylglucosamine O-acyltransferase [Planctomycetota bacterium]
MKIHPTALVDSAAEVGANAEIGPYAWIGPNVTVGDDCTIGHGCHIEGHVTIGRNNILSPYVMLGTPPQDLKYHGQPTQLIVGDDNVFREFVTINIGTVTGNGLTKIGNRNYLMICSHIGHDCALEDEVILGNGVLFGGHCYVETGAKLMGGTAVNPFVTVGQQCYVGGLSRIVHDVPPFMIVEGNPARARSVNEIGLQRAGHSQKAIDELWDAFKAIYRTRELNRAPIYDVIESKPGACDEAVYLVQFLRRRQEGVHGRYREGLRNH